MAALTTVVIPVRDESLSTLAALCQQVQAHGYPLIVVDDGSQVPCPLATLRLVPGRGYGAALKAGIAKASTDLVATMDGDGQHAVWDVKRLEDFMTYFPHLAMVIGDRRVQERGHRYWGRKLLNWLASGFAGRVIPDLNSGLRIVRRNVALGYAPILCDQFSYTTTLTLALLADQYAVDWLPIKVAPRRHGQSKVRMWRDGWITLRSILWVGLALRTRRLRAWRRGWRFTSKPLSMP